MSEEQPTAEAVPEDVPKYRCRGCGHQSPSRWRGACPGCGRWYNVVDPRGAKNGAASLAERLKTIKPKIYIPTGIMEIDKVLGGGFVPCSTVLFGGPKGCGKTTFYLQMADGVAHCRGGVVVAAGEDTAESLVYYAQRLGLKNVERLRIFGIEDGTGEFEKVIEDFCEPKPTLLIIDSLQTTACGDVEGDFGSGAQCDAVINSLTSWAKREKVACMVVCHMNKAGDYAGTEKVLHLVDTLMQIDYAPDADEEIEELEHTKFRRIYIAQGKNRNANGPVSEAQAILEMTGEGLKSIERGRRKKGRKVIFDGE